nr:hypothetical protein [uncultured Flavobacterium sp.]
MVSLIVLAVGLLGILLGYLIGKSSVGSPNSSRQKADLAKYKKKLSRLADEIESLKKKNEAAATPILGFSAPLIVEPFDEKVASTVLGKKVQENDLTVIEGIGPKVEELLKTSGILTWKSLSETSVDRCNEILSKAGELFSFHNPATWPRQARLAYQRKWNDLKAWQESLQSGVE